MGDDQEHMKEGRSRERIWRDSSISLATCSLTFAQPCSLRLYRAGSSGSRLLGVFRSQNHQLRSFRSAVYSSPLKREVVFIFSYIPTLFFRVFGHFEKPLFFELCKYIQTKFVPANTLLFRPGQVCFHFFASFTVT